METVTHSKLNPERLFPADPKLRAVTRKLYQEVKDLPLISPHGHTDPQWFPQIRISPMPRNCS